MSNRLVMWFASGALVAAGLAACGDEPPVGKGATGGDQTLSRVPQLSATPQAADPAEKVDQNTALATRVIAALRRDPVVGKLGIDVVSADGAVTLFGTTPTAGDSEQAAQVAAGVDGVRSVTNNLLIVTGS